VSAANNFPAFNILKLRPVELEAVLLNLRGSLLTTKTCGLLEQRRCARAVKNPAAIFLHPPVAEFQKRFLTQKLRGFR
jgi:hypothetical protein